MRVRRLITELAIVSALLGAGCSAAPEAAGPDSATAATATSSRSASASASPKLPYERVCRMTTHQLPEISGLTSSIRHDGILWTHNDSGDAARIFAIDTATCQVRAVVELRGVSARDVEAIGTGRRADGTPVIWVGDIGGNTYSGSTPRLYRLDEPTELVDQSVATDQFGFTYPDGGADAEGLLVDPAPGGRLWVVTKSLAARAGIYALPVGFGAGPGDGRPQVGSGSKAVAVRVGSAPLLATDASYAPDGTRYVIRTYFGAQLYSAPPPNASGTSVRLPLADEGQVQGEAIAFAQDSRSVFVAAEHSRDIFQVPLP